MYVLSAGTCFLTLQSGRSATVSAMALMNIGLAARRATVVIQELTNVIAATNGLLMTTSKLVTSDTAANVACQWSSEKNNNTK